VTLILTRVVPDGFEFDIEVQLRRPQPDSVLDSEGDRWVPFYMDDVGALPKDDLPDYVFRLGIEYPGGGRTSTLPWTKQGHSAPVTPLLIGASREIATNRPGVRGTARLAGGVRGK